MYLKRLLQTLAALRIITPPPGLKRSAMRESGSPFDYLSQHVLPFSTGRCRFQQSKTSLSNGTR
jgi:hypothetical protein